MSVVGLALLAVAVLATAVQAAGPNCLFLHGVGQKGPEKAPAGGNSFTDPAFMRTSMDWYWGDMDARAKAAGCETTRFYWCDTLSRGWDVASLQVEQCGAIAAFKADIVFTHSMGNNVIAAGVKNGVKGCDNIGTGATQVHWVGLQGPLAGTVAADKLAILCQNPVIGKLPDCTHNPAGGTMVKPSYGSLTVAALSKAGLNAIAAKHMAGNMCGIGAHMGMGSDINGLKGVGERIEREVLSLGLSTIATLVSGFENGQNKDWAAKPNKDGGVPVYGNDGMVEFASCRIAPITSYKKDPTADYYVLFGNHADGRCSQGEDPKSAGTQQCTYMANMIKKMMKTKGMKTGPPLVRFAAVQQDETDAAADEIADEVRAFVGSAFGEVEAVIEHELTDATDSEEAETDELETESEEETEAAEEAAESEAESEEEDSEQ